MQNLSVFIDESGDPSLSPNASRHFVLAAVIINAEDIAKVGTLLAGLKGAVGEKTLHWADIRNMQTRRCITGTLAERVDLLKIATVVVDKDAFPFGVERPVSREESYTLTLGYLLERISWYARDNGKVATVTMEHLRGFREGVLTKWCLGNKKTPGQSNIDWTHIKEWPKMVHSSTSTFLELADVAAGATSAAFEKDTYGNTDDTHLHRIMPLVIRRPGGCKQGEPCDGSCLYSYGIKIHPTLVKAEKMKPVLSPRYIDTVHNAQ